MKTVLSIVGVLALLGFAGLFGLGFALQKGWIADAAAPPQNAPSQKSTPVSSGVRLAGGKDPLDEAGVGCNYSYDKVTKTYKITEGEPFYTGHLRFWLTTDCPNGANVRFGPRWTLRESRLWVNCNNQRVWIEFTRYVKEGETLPEYQPMKTFLGSTTAMEGNDLEDESPGEIIAPHSVLSPFTDKFCPMVQSGKSAK
jgi:hypothetical protein